MIEIINKNIITKLFVIKNGLLVITLPDKDVLYIGNKNSNLTGYLNIHSKNIFNRIVKFGAIGFSEAYIHNEISSPDISKVILLLYFLAANSANPPQPQPISSILSPAFISVISHKLLYFLFCAVNNSSSSLSNNAEE